MWRFFMVDESTFLSSDESIEDRGVEAATAGQFLVARLEEREAERARALQFAQEYRREELRGVGYGCDDERAPAHAEQVLERCRAGWEAFELGAHEFAEVEQLDDEGIERDVCGRSASEERG